MPKAVGYGWAFDFSASYTSNRYTEALSLDKKKYPSVCAAKNTIFQVTGTKKEKWDYFFSATTIIVGFPFTCHIHLHH